MIQACAEDTALQAPLSNGEVSMDQDEIESTGQMLYKMELILSLIEILFIDTKPGMQFPSLSLSS